MKRALVITYYWPPTGGSGVQRWVKFAKYLPQFGWQPVIYTPENPEQLAVDESLLADIPAGTEVLKTRIVEPYGAYRRIFGAKQEVNPINANGDSWKRKFSKWIRGNCFIPDPRISWVRPSVKYLTRYLEKHPVDVIITTGPPHSMHLIGRKLHRITGIRWIADFRDPWTEMFYFKHLCLTQSSERKHRRLEQSVLDEADAIIGVSPMVCADFQARTKTEVHLITNGFDSADFPPLADSGERRGTFNVVHTGLFAADGNPLFLWDELARKCAKNKEFKDKLQIRLAGKIDSEIIDAIKDRGMEGNLVNLGYLPHNKTVEEQRNANILILPLRQEPEYRKVVPGKIFEYLAARRPVMGIGQEDSAAASILRECWAGDMYEWDQREQMHRFIECEWEKFVAGETDRMNSEIDRYERKELTARLTKIL